MRATQEKKHNARSKSSSESQNPCGKKGQEMEMQYEEKKEHRFKLGSLQAVKRVIKLQTGAKIDNTLTESYKKCFSEKHTIMASATVCLAGGRPHRVGKLKTFPCMLLSMID